MRQTLDAGSTITLDNGQPATVLEYTIDGPDIEWVRVDGAVMPDPNWVFVDSYGHEHRWEHADRRDLSRPEALPTLNRSYVHIDCDGTCGNWDCDGYDDPVWHCILCGDEVTPGTIPDYQARNRGIPFERGPARMRFRVTGDLPEDPWRSASTEPMRAVLASPSGGSRAGKAWLTGEIEHDFNEPPTFWVEIVFD